MRAGAAGFYLLIVCICIVVCWGVFVVVCGAVCVGCLAQQKIPIFNSVIQSMGGRNPQYMKELHNEYPDV